MLLFVGCVLAVVLGYFYKKALERENVEDFMGDANPVGYSNPNERQYLYRAGEGGSNQQPQSKRF